MNEPTRRQPVWLQILQSIAALFLIAFSVNKIVGLIYWVVDPSARALQTADNTVAAERAVTVGHAITYALVGLIGFGTLALVALMFVAVNWAWNRSNLVLANLHGRPGVVSRRGITVIDQDPRPVVPATYEELPAGPGPRPSIYQMPLNPRFLYYGQRQDGQLLRSPLVDKGLTGVFGLTRTGKTEFLAALIITAVRLSRERGVPLEVVVVDPKGNDFSRMPRLPIMPYPVVTQPKDCLELAQTLVADNAQRQRELQRRGAVSVAHLQQLGGAMPVRLVVIDEVTETLLHLSKGQGEKYVDALQSLAQTSASYGNRVYIASQRPAAKEFPRRVTGQLEGGRVVFRCDTAIESQIALGEAGAELLPPQPGAMLYRLGADTVRGQAFHADLKYHFYPYLQECLMGSSPVSLTATEAPVTIPQGGEVETATPPLVVEGFPQDRLANCPAEYDLAYDAYVTGKGIKPAARALFPSKEGEPAHDGGQWFYWARYAIGRALEARGQTVAPEWLVVPPKYLPKEDK